MLFVEYLEYIENSKEKRKIVIDTFIQHQILNNYGLSGLALTLWFYDEWLQIYDPCAQVLAYSKGNYQITIYEKQLRFL